MAPRKISPSSLKNLYRSNKESNQLTRESLETALLFLLEQKDLGQISISELVRKAGVSRNAFYRNYKSKEEILETAYERTSQALADKWHAFQKKIIKEGSIQHNVVDFFQQQKDKVGEIPTVANVSQWIAEQRKKLGE